MVRTRLIPFTLALMTTAASVTAMGASVPFLVGHAVAQTAVDDRPAADLSDEELLARFQATQSVVRDKSADKALRKRLRGQMREDRAELKRRNIDARSDDSPEEAADEQEAAPKAAEQQAAPEPKEQSTEQKAAPEPKKKREIQAAPAPTEQPAEQQAAPAAKEQPAEQPAAPAGAKAASPAEPTPEPAEKKRRRAEQPEQPAEPVAQQQAAPKQEQQPEATRRQKNRDNAADGTQSRTELIAQRIVSGNVPPASLDDQRLRERHQTVQRLMDDDSIDKGTRKDLRRIFQLDTAELVLRGIGLAKAPVPRVSESDRRAQDIIADRRPAKRLNDAQLRRRLDDIRDVLGSDTLSERYVADLRSTLREDRAELRARVATRVDEREDRNQNADGGRYRDDDRDRSSRRELRTLLRDDRPSSTLSAAALTARSGAAREALDAGNLRSDQAEYLRTMLQSDRRELRSRLRAERDQRRRELRGKRKADGLRIEIRPNVRPARRENIAAAEVDTDALEQQLVAPPTRRIERQYTFDEYVRRPELRDVMPGIELDTIHFGFNEYFVREEEIDELERIGEIIERILSANPDEVFVVEGHTDAVGSDGYNLDLSRKRADAVRKALLEYFVIEPENLKIVGYGERYLKIPTPDEEAENRRVTVRRITPILSRR